MTEKESIILLLDRVKIVGDRFGTLTDIQAIYRTPEIGEHEFSETDIKFLRRIIETGIIANPLFRRPDGHKTLNFIIALRNEQAKRYNAKREQERIDLIHVFKNAWIRNIEKANGDIEAAKTRMAEFWGSNLEMDSSTRSIFNQAYKLAKSQWDQR